MLKRLLDYLGREAIAGRADDLKEYRVGVEAFGKPEDYDPQLDSSVRVQAGKLRQKIDEYYRTEGLDDPILVDLPKGHYQLEFRPRDTEAPTTVPAVRRYRTATAIVGVLLLVALSAGLGWMARGRVSDRSAVRWSPEMEALWAPFLNGQRPVLVTLGAPLFTKVGDWFFRDPAVNTWDNALKSEAVESLRRMAGSGTASPAFIYTGIGEAIGAFTLAKLFTTHGVDVSLHASNLLTWEDIHDHNVIFVGPAKYNVQMKDLPVSTDFVFMHSRVENLKPQPNEPRFFAEKRLPDGQLAEGHALVTRLPGLQRAGTILVLAATSTEGTRAAVEFVTRPEHAVGFVRFMHRVHGGIPPYFQAVVRVQYKSQTPLSIEQVAFHVLK
ncbi:MAG: hypothetical protein ABFD86_08325 [Bryobacteraceae bacterium]